MIINKLNNSCKIEMLETLKLCANKMNPDLFKNVIYKLWVYKSYI